MDIFGKLKEIAGLVESYDWKDVSTNHNVFQIWQTFLESMYMAYLQRPVQVRTLDLKIGTNEEFSCLTLEKFDSVDLLDEEKLTGSSLSEKPFEKLKEHIEFVLLERSFDLAGASLFQTIITKGAEVVKEKQTEKKKQTKVAAKRQSHKRKQPGDGEENLSVISIEPVGGEDETAIEPNASDAELMNQSDAGYIETPDSRTYGTRRVRKRKKHFNEEEFEIDWPRAVKKEKTDEVTPSKDVVRKSSKKESKKETKVEAQKESKSENKKECNKESKKGNEKEKSSKADAVVVADETEFTLTCSICDSLPLESKEEASQHFENVHKPADSESDKAEDRSCMQCKESSLKPGTSYGEHIKKIHLKRKKSNLYVTCPKCPLAIQCFSKGTGKLKVLLDEMHVHMVESHELSSDVIMILQDKIKEEADGDFVPSNELDSDDSWTEEAENKEGAKKDKPSKKSPQKSVKKSTKKSVKKKGKVGLKVKVKGLKKEKPDGGECPCCGLYVLERGRNAFKRHVSTCRKDPAVKSVHDMVNIPNSLPTEVPCPFCKEDAPSFSKVHEIVAHIVKKHEKCDTCPRCDLKWDKEVSRGMYGKNFNPTEKAAHKMFLHFVISHNYLVPGMQTETEKAPSTVSSPAKDANQITSPDGRANSESVAGSASSSASAKTSATESVSPRKNVTANASASTSEDVTATKPATEPVAEPAAVTATETATEPLAELASAPASESALVSIPASTVPGSEAEVQVVTTLAQVAEAMVTQTDTVAIMPQDVNAQISFLDSDTLASVTAVKNLLRDEQGLSGPITVQFVDGELDMSAVENVAGGHNVQYVQYIEESDAVTHVIHLEETREEAAAEVPSDADVSNAVVDYSNIRVPFPEESVSTCFICEDRPRFVQRKTYQDHNQSLHVKKSVEASSQEYVECPECDAVFNEASCTKPGMFEYLALHQMLHHKKPRPDHLPVLRCPTCQFETIVTRLFNHHFYRNVKHDCKQPEETGLNGEAVVEKEYQCVLCRFNDKSGEWPKMNDKDYLQHWKEQHMRKVGNSLAIECSVCCKSYTSTRCDNMATLRTRRCLAYFTNHLWQAHEAELPMQDKTIKCDVCSEITLEGYLYEVHMKKKHPFLREHIFKKPDEEICESCSGLLKQEVMDKHRETCSRVLRTLQRSDKVICEICGISVTYDHYVNRHMETCSGQMQEKKKEIQCTECGRAYYTQGQLREHMNKIHKKKEPVQCQVCQVVLPCHDAYEEHMMNVHQMNVTGRMLVNCPVCDYKGIRKMVKDHCRETHGMTFSMHNPVPKLLKPNAEVKQPKVKPAFVACPHCEYKAKDEGALKSHLAHIHNIGRFDCQLCKFVTISQNALDRHMARRHPSGETNVNYCSVCEKEYSSLVAFENHMFVKHKINQSTRSVVTCEKCGFQTLGQALLNNHMKVHNRGSHVCEICNKTCETRNNYISHRRRHFRRLNCPSCEMIFVDTGGLNRHIARVHNDMVFKCDFCPYVTFTDRLYKIHLQVKHDCSAELCQTLIENVKGVSRTRRKSRANAHKQQNMEVSSGEESDDGTADGFMHV